MLTRSLSVVFCVSPRMYRLVLLSCCSPDCGAMLLLREVLSVPLCDPVLLLLLEFVLAGEAAVGTRCDPYWNTQYSGNIVFLWANWIIQYYIWVTISASICFLSRIFYLNSRTYFNASLTIDKDKNAREILLRNKSRRSKVQKEYPLQN